MSDTVELRDVEAAAARIGPHVEHTPSGRSRTLGDLVGLDVVLKHENLQFTASFKERGAANRLAVLIEQHAREGTPVPGVVTMSAGNHAQAVARHAERLGIDATIVMPADTPFVKVHRTQVLGGRVVLAGAGLAGATAEARRIEAEEGRFLLHPFDDPAVIAGQGTVALELLADHPDLGALVVPVGGGGLLAGMAVAARALRPDLVLIGVQSERWPSMLDAVPALDARPPGRSPGPVGGSTVADGIAVPVAGSLTASLIAAHADALVTVADDAIESAVNLLLEIEKVVVEGAGAVGLAALAALDDTGLRRRLEGRPVGVVLSGGNIDPRLLASVVMRGLVRSGRLTRLVVEVADAPGSLAAVAAILGAAGANVVELAHDRMLLDVSARSAELEVVVETFDQAHLDRVVAALSDGGFPAAVVSPGGD